MIRILPLLCLLMIASPVVSADVTSAEDQGIEILFPPDHVRVEWSPIRPLYGYTAFNPLLTGLLGSSEALDRSRGALLLGMVGSHDSAKDIVPLLNDSDRTVRVASGLALGLLGDTQGIHVCDAVLRSDPEWLRLYAVYSLWCMDSSRAKAVLKRNLDVQGKTVGDVIRRALRTPFTVTKGKWSLSPDSRKDARPADVWTALCDVFIVASDEWFHGGDYGRTIDCLEAALFFQPTYADGYSLIAWLQWSMGDDKTAISTLERGIKALPDSPDTWGALGQHYWLTKRYALAEEPLRKALDLGGDRLVRGPYAVTLEKLGKVAESLAQWEIIVRENPDDPAGPVNVERLRKKLADSSGK